MQVLTMASESSASSSKGAGALVEMHQTESAQSTSSHTRTSLIPHDQHSVSVRLPWQAVELIQTCDSARPAARAVFGWGVLERSKFMSLSGLFTTPVRTPRGI
jgi:hypothetical protein